jgi:hypothetical protein
MEFIEKYYVIIISIGLFIVFSLVGYLIEIIKKNNKEYKANEENENIIIDNSINNNLVSDKTNIIIEDKNNI